MYYQPPAIMVACVRKAAEITHQPIPVPQDFLVLQTLHSLRAYMPDVTPMTLREQETAMEQVNALGKITMIPASLQGTHPPLGEMSKFAKKIPTDQIDEPHGAGPPTPAQTPINAQIQHYHYMNNFGSADAKYCDLAQAFPGVRKRSGIGIPRDDDMWPTMNAPNPMIPTRK